MRQEPQIPIPRWWLTDTALTNRARGRLVSLLAIRADGWTSAEVLQSSTQNRHASYAVVAELLHANYLMRGQGRTVGGRATPVVYRLGPAAVDPWHNAVVPPGPRSWVYYARRGDGNIKIGVATNLRARLGHLTAEHGALDLLATEQGSYDVETQRHTEFDEFRVEGEWFRPSVELLTHVNGLVK